MCRKLNNVGMQHVEQHAMEWFTGMLAPSEHTAFSYVLGFQRKIRL
jgi:hypothetical protein